MSTEPRLPFHSPASLCHQVLNEDKLVEPSLKRHNSHAAHSEPGSFPSTDQMFRLCTYVAFFRQTGCLNGSDCSRCCFAVGATVEDERSMTEFFEVSFEAHSIRCGLRLAAILSEAFLLGPSRRRLHDVRP